jgi:hypothetical protein
MKETIEANEVLAEQIIEPVIEEVKEPYHDNNWDLVYLRNTRNSLLELTDKYLLPDYPITPENLEVIKLYRQTLRNFINNHEQEILNGSIVEIPPIPF